MGHMSENDLDKVDLQLLNRVAEMSGKSVTRIVKTLDCRTVHTLRDRLDRLSWMGYVRLDRTTYRGKVLVYLTDSGRVAITGWEDAAPGGEVTSL
jgi:DNA-binding MarR family transcriptional regulator